MPTRPRPDAPRPRRPKAGVAGLALALLAGLAAGCAQGPKVEVLQQEVQGRLDDRFGQGTFEVVELRRNGSYPFSEKTDPRPRLLVYFKARLRFARDAGLGRSDAPNAAVLASTLGSTTSGISGIAPGGNKKGDELKVFGTATYIQEGKGWVRSDRLAPGGASSSGGVGIAERLGEDPVEARLQRLGELYRRLSNKNLKPHLVAFERETWWAERNLMLQLDALDGRLSLLTSGKANQYTALGRGLAQVGKKLGVELRDYRSSGSVENCRMVGEGRAAFGIVQGDIAAAAVAGRDFFAGRDPLEDLRAVCALFPEAIQVVTLESSPVRSIADLRGKRVAIGPKGSGSRVNAIQVLEAYGLGREDLAERREVKFADAIAQLEAGEVDAFFITMFDPSEAIEQLDRAQAIRMVPIDGPPAEALVKAHPYLRPMAIPAGTYPDLKEDVPTLGATAMVVTHAKTPDAQVDALLDLLFKMHGVLEGQKGKSPIRVLRAPEAFAEQANMTSFLHREAAKKGMSIPVHPAAARYLGLP